MIKLKHDSVIENKIMIYESDDNIKVEVILEDENIWLTQDQISKLYNKAKSTINEHIKNIYSEHELSETNTMRKFGNSEFSTKPKNYYNLDMIIAIGFRVKSKEGTKFRIWANEKLKEYLIKGYNLNVERFKNNGNDPYFDELLDKIRDIRSSEKVFWRKILDIYATSVDYNPKKEITINFFKTVQNKMHYAVSNNTAAEIVHATIDKKSRSSHRQGCQERFEIGFFPWIPVIQCFSHREVVQDTHYQSISDHCNRYAVDSKICGKHQRHHQYDIHCQCHSCMDHRKMGFADSLENPIGNVRHTVHDHCDHADHHQMSCHAVSGGE